MADNRTAKANPRIVFGGSGVFTEVPAAATTWKAGEFLTVSSGLATACASDATSIRYLSLTAEATTLVAGVAVKVFAIAADTILEMYANTEDTHDIDVAVTSAAMGNSYGLMVGSNYHTLNLSMNTASTSPLNVVDYAARYSPLTDTAATSPGRAYVKVAASFLTVA